MNSNSFKPNFFYKISEERLSYYEKNAVYFSKPLLVDFLDYNNGRVTKAKRLKYLREPKYNEYPIDLNVDLGKFKIRSNKLFPKSIEYVLKYDMSCAEELSTEKTKVFTRRGTMVSIMHFYYIKMCDSKVLVSRYNNNLYIVAFETDEGDAELKPVHTHHCRLQNLLFTDSPNGPNNINEPCDENIMLIGVHRSTFGKYDVISSGEIQGIIEEDEIIDFDNLEKLTDLRFVFSKQMWKSLEGNHARYLKIWLQSYLANVRDVYIGYKNPNGIIDEPIRHEKVKNLYKNRYWKPEICTGVLYDFLQNVEQLMSSVNCLHTVYEFEYNKNGHFFTYQIFKGKTNKSFITEEYATFCKAHSSMEAKNN